MTDPVKRYDCSSGGARFCQGCYTMEECEHGDYVQHEDYARLEQECERLRNELNNMRISWGLMQSEREAALKQVEGLRDLLADWSSHFTGPKLIGGPLSSLRERTEETLSAKP